MWDLYNRMILTWYHCIPLAVLFAIVIVACSPYPDITSESIAKISSEKFTSIDWSPDGSTLLATGPYYHPTENSHLYSFDVATGGTTRLTENPDGYTFPAWSPDGRKAALTVLQNTIWIFDITSRRSTYLAAGEGAVWLPEGDKLAIYVGPLTNGDTDHREIRIVDLQGSIFRTIDVGAVIPELLELKPYIAKPIERLSGLDISPDGSQLIFSLNLYKGKLEGQDRGENVQEAYLVDMRDGNVIPFLPGDPIGFVSWAPDGTKIAYIRHEILETGQLVIVDQETRCWMIPDLPAEIRSPTWSNDSSHLALLYVQEIHILDTNLYLKLYGSGCP